MHRLPQNLRYLRRQRDLSMQELADQIVIDGKALNAKTYQTYEHGRREPSIKVLKALAAFFEIGIDDLCYKTYDENN